jgi:hypothetical protein
MGLSGVRQQGNLARALDCLGELPLVMGAVAVDAPRYNLAAFRHKVAESFDILVINHKALVRAKTADLATVENLLFLDNHVLFLFSGSLYV